MSECVRGVRNAHPSPRILCRYWDLISLTVSCQARPRERLRSLNISTAFPARDIFCESEVYTVNFINISFTFTIKSCNTFLNLTHEFDNNLNQRIWNSKHLLRRTYLEFFRLIEKHIDRTVKGSIVELGSGGCHLRQIIQDVICTDIHSNPWIDQVENCYQLSFPDNSVGHIIMFDVFHHLQYPGSALNEIHRKLVPGGKLILFEPDMGLLGRIIYGVFHCEPVELYRDIKWYFNPSVLPPGDTHYSAQSNAYKIFIRNQTNEDLKVWKLIKCKRYSALTYIASGGFSRQPLYPEYLYRYLKKTEKLLDQFPAIFATRLLVSLEKRYNGVL